MFNYGKKSTIQPLNMSISKLFQNALDTEASQFLFGLLATSILATLPELE